MDFRSSSCANHRLIRNHIAWMVVVPDDYAVATGCQVHFPQRLRLRAGRGTPSQPVPSGALPPFWSSSESEITAKTSSAWLTVILLRWSQLDSSPTGHSHTLRTVKNVRKSIVGAVRHCFDLVSWTTHKGASLVTTMFFSERLWINASKEIIKMISHL